MISPSARKKKKNILKRVPVSLFFSALVKNIWHEYVSFKSLLYRRGQKVTISP